MAKKPMKLGLADALIRGVRLGFNLEKRYYIRCTLHEGQQEMALWWRPNNSGYTYDLNEAGRYTRDEALDIVRGRRGEIAVPCDVVDQKVKLMRTLPRFRFGDIPVEDRIHFDTKEKS